MAKMDAKQDFRSNKRFFERKIAISPVRLERTTSGSGSQFVNFINTCDFVSYENGLTYGVRIAPHALHVAVICSIKLVSKSPRSRLPIAHFLDHFSNTHS
jgi:hypothetical protein